MTDNIPLTEFSSEEGLISPDFEHLSLRLPSRCLMAFLGGEADCRLCRRTGRKNHRLLPVPHEKISPL